MSLLRNITNASKDCDLSTHGHMQRPMIRLYGLLAPVYKFFALIGLLSLLLCVEGDDGSSFLVRVEKTCLAGEFCQGLIKFVRLSVLP